MRLNNLSNPPTAHPAAYQHRDCSHRCDAAAGVHPARAWLAAHQAGAAHEEHGAEAAAKALESDVPAVLSPASPRFGGGLPCREPSTQRARGWESSRWSAQVERPAKFRQPAARPAHAQPASLACTYPRPPHATLCRSCKSSGSRPRAKCRRPPWPRAPRTMCKRKTIGTCPPGWPLWQGPLSARRARRWRTAGETWVSAWGWQNWWDMPGRAVHDCNAECNLALLPALHPPAVPAAPLADSRRQAAAEAKKKRKRSPIEAMYR